MELVRHALFGRPLEYGIFANAEWKSIMQLAWEQTLLGVAFDGMSDLPKEEQPELKLKLRWIACVREIEKRNAILDEKMVDIRGFLETKGWKAIIVKGQVIAREYPCPEHRQSGDIDVFFPCREDAENAFRWAKKNFECKWMPGEKEIPFEWDGIEVEFHRRLAEMQYRKYNTELQRIIHEETSNGKDCYVNVCGHAIETTSTLLTVLHLIVHVAHHILNSGVGWRQMCDLALFLNNHYNAIDKTHLNDCLQCIGLQRIAAAIGFLLHEELGLDGWKIPFAISSDGAAIIIYDIWTGGNFGKKRQISTDESFLRYKLRQFPVQTKRYFRYRDLFPHEAEANFMAKFARAARGIK